MSFFMSFFKSLWKQSPPESQPEQPPKLPPLGLMILAGVLFVGSVAGILWGSQTGTPKSLAVISVDGTHWETISLHQVTAPYTIELEPAPGQYNEILVAPGEISMAQANCPDGLCVAQGVSTGVGQPIVCLPHRVVINFRENEDSLDAYTG